LVEKVGRKTHPGAAMVVAASLDRLLEEAILTKMIKLSTEMHDKLFGDYGSLQDFSIKIDLSFTLGLLDSKTYKLLRTIRKVRNAFAHADGAVDFNSPEILKWLPSKSAPFEEFMSIAKAIEAAVTTAIGSPHRGIIDKVKEDWS
jgi:DNA-binding MltR family transcriptional regulator